MLKKIDLLNIISEPLRGKVSPSARYAVHIRPEIMRGYLARAFGYELERTGSTLQDPEEVNAKIRAVSKWLTDGQRKPFLLLYGSKGRGKSALARAIHHVVVDDIPRLENQLYHIVDAEKTRIDKHERKLILQAIGDDPNKTWIDWGLIRANPDLNQAVQPIQKRAQGARDAIKPYENKLARLRASVRKEDAVCFVTGRDLVSGTANEGYNNLEQYYSVPLLFIDDVGEEADSVSYMGNRIMPITEILFRRYDRRAVTIITSNLSDKGLAERYGERIGDRLNEVADKISFIGESYRK